ncbi:MucR family transcriptional regulator [Methylorubrum extorquens]|uniref:Transcriptional regulator, MucR family n=1 Tax=Methylorubrum extorquens (strain CM4 / NCIMB 13688) TaxID=440085 RepID=B7KXP3_METC4|nr:MucR family transcriptional regulator [Methylorubrum extorquens]ACK84645.1 transcriptional regulator, MucR family [Methylorubrum extorquens CM4]
MIRKSYSSAATAEPVDLTIIVASAYGRNHTLAATDLPGLIQGTYSALAVLKAEPEAHAVPKVQRLTVGQIRRPITTEGLTFFVDGKPYMMLKRHLRRHGLDPDSYRARYGLPADYPMVAPSYSERRSEIARSFGLPHRRRKWPAKADEGITSGA